MTEPRATFPSVRGRGAAFNVPVRFERLSYDPHDTAEEGFELREHAPRTQFFRDHARTIIATNTSPDIPYRASINPYRGCEHGCAYCYARPTHEFLGLSAGLDFESKIMVKLEAAPLLRKELAARRWTPQVIAMSGVTDIYQPAERHYRLTRACLEVLLDHRNPVSLITKNALITRDLDVLAELARRNLVRVALSITTLDEALRRSMEPRTSTAQARLDAVARLTEAGVPVSVMVGPVIPGLNDEELPRIVREAARAGAVSAGYNVVHFPGVTADLFMDWLTREQPQRRARVEALIREVRGGELDDPRFGQRMTGTGPYAEQLRALFRAAVRQAGMRGHASPLDTSRFRVPTAMPSLFDLPD
ncbi:MULTISPECIES: PA0069 family radical SAM protein [Deinococcus]|uniref:PA0069 family radical SAM protein n=1 Tax=Deinococcus rufus TaxID=2136097 RepID=A0ABV7ZC79_9DEIO|nr:PA0069 family radical SAM protein [Deinococcus sp. AB2017081]WQE94202.1 PA0069 family radical SAM protein [Deinococcus sp. AB2017081]